MNPEIIGFVAGGLSAVLFVPQIQKIFRERSAREISALTWIIGIISSGLWLWYGIPNHHISMMVMNAVSIFITGVLLVCKWYFDRKESGLNLP